MRINGDVDVVVAGNKNNVHLRVVREDDRPEADEMAFYNDTGMVASAPARVALRRLLREDVTARTLRVIWRRHLHFEDGQFRANANKFAPWWGLSMLVMFAVSSLSFVASSHFDVPRAYRGLLAMLAFMSTGMLVITTFADFRPYVIAKRVKPIVDRINPELTELGK